MTKRSKKNMYGCIFLIYLLSDSFTADLWEEAIEKLDDELQNKIRSRNQELVNLESVLSSAESKKEECHNRGNETGSKLYQVLGRVVQRLSKFKDIGDSVATIDPTHLAVPWAVIKLVLQVCACAQLILSNVLRLKKANLVAHARFR